MKNIILVSQGRLDISEKQQEEIVQKILEDGRYQIILMVLNPMADKKKYLDLGVAQVVDSLELEYVESMEGLDYGDIAACKDLQLEIENGIYRMFGDYQLGKYYYYSAMCFWNRFFEKNKVDIVLHTKDYHGFYYDCVDVIARKFGVNSFHMRFLGYHHTFCIYSAHKIIPIFCGNVPNVEYLLEASFDKTLLPPTVENKSLFRQLLYNLGGNLLEDFMVRMLKWNWKARSWERKRKKIYWSDKFIGYMKLCSTKRYMNSLSYMPDYNKKYICYFLHAEPEATTQITTILESQLVIIKILSETIPSGWEIYVKEHPAQFDANNDSGYYHMVDYPLYKTKEFYKKIASIPHVKIISYKVKSEELVTYSQAVATMAGTVLFESVLQKKPIIAFSDLNPMSFLEDAFSIHSYDDCEQAMKKIEKGFRPQYIDADEIVHKYAFKGEYMAYNILALIDCECSDN